MATPSPRLGRRTLLAGIGLGLTCGRAAALPTVRLGILPFGSVQWIADVIVHHQLDRAHGFALQTMRLANTEAAKVALLGRAVDVAYSDWPFVAAQREHGGTLVIAAGGSASLGGVMVPASSPVRGLADLKGLRLGVAGGAADKSWLLVRAAAHASGVDLTREATLSFGAPPLLDSLQRRGELDALLTFWNFAARLEVAGQREAITVADCARIVGLPAPPTLLGYVFDEGWAKANRAAIDGFLAASASAIRLLAGSTAEWARIRGLMDASDDALFENLRGRFLAGAAHPDSAAMRDQAAKLQTLLAAQDKAAGPAVLPAGMFWPAADVG